MFRSVVRRTLRLLLESVVVTASSADDEEAGEAHEHCVHQGIVRHGAVETSGAWVVSGQGGGVVAGAEVDGGERDLPDVRCAPPRRC